MLGSLQQDICLKTATSSLVILHAIVKDLVIHSATSLAAALPPGIASNTPTRLLDLDIATSHTTSESVGPGNQILKPSLFQC